MDFTNLTHENFILYAMKHYENPSCTGFNEFKEDVEKLKYIKRLLKRYQRSQTIKERLVLNHLVVLFNVFGLATTRILFFKLEEELYPQLKTFLVFLNYMPDIVIGIKGRNIYSVDIPLDQNLIDQLRRV